MKGEKLYIGNGNILIFSTKIYVDEKTEQTLRIFKVFFFPPSWNILKIFLFLLNIFKLRNYRYRFYL